MNNTDEKHIYAVKIGNKYVRVKSYSDFTLVDHPHRGTLFSREKDALERLLKKR